jgi:hypothetical protein
MKKNKNLIYLLLLAGAAVAFIAFKKKPKLKGKVLVDDLEKPIDSPDYNFEGETKKETVESTPDILIREVKEAVQSTPEPLSTILKKAKGIFKKKPKKVKTTKTVTTPPIFTTKNTSRTFVQQALDIAKAKQAVIKKAQQKKQVKKKTPKKRLKGFDDISVLY